MKSLSSIEVSAIVKEIHELEGSKVSKIYQPDKTEVVIEFFKTGKGKFLLRIVPGTSLYVTTFKRANPKEILSFCKFLRKRLSNVFLDKIEQKRFERIVEFKFSTKETSYYLIIELFSKGNIIFCDENFRIISALQVQLWKDRKIKAGEIYEYPPTSNVDIFNVDEKEFKDILMNSEKESIVKTLAVDIGMGGVYSEELCLRTSIDKNSEVVSNEEISRLFNELKKMADLNIDARLYEDDATPFPLLRYQDKVAEETSTFNDALDKYYSRFLKEDKAVEHKKAYEKKLKAQKNILEQQEQQMEELEKAAEFNKEKGDMVYKNYMHVKEVLDTIKNARSRNIPWREIEEKLKSKGIIVNGKEGRVTLELE